MRLSNMYSKSTLWPETPSVCLTELEVPAGVIYLIPMLTECFRDLLLTCKILIVGFWASTKQLIHSSRLTFMLQSVSQDSEDGKWIANSRWALFEELWEHCTALSVSNTLLSCTWIKVSLLLKESQCIDNSGLLEFCGVFSCSFCVKRKSPYDCMETFEWVLVSWKSKSRARG